VLLLQIAQLLKRVPQQIGCHAYLTAVRWVPRSIAPSSVATESSMMSPFCKYFGLFAWRLKNAFYSTVGGSGEAIGFGGAVAAWTHQELSVRRIETLMR
jgi:hypothetical protein